MDVDRDHVVHLANGRLSDASPNSTTSRADVARMVNAALDLPNPQLIIHVHGGLVDEKAGRGIAAKLAPRYSAPSRYPLFFVWESGLIESIANNLDDIGHDSLFRELVKKSTRWVLAQLPGAAGLKGAGGAVDVHTLDREYDEWFSGRRADLPTALQASSAKPVSLKSAISPPSEHDLALKIRLELDKDSDFKQVLSGLHASISPTDVAAPIPKANGIGARVSPLTEIAPNQVVDVFDITPQTKGVVSMAKAALFIAKVVIAVVKRLTHGRAHGLYTTIVEEVLGAAYLDKVGGLIWGQMKKDTADAFADPATCGGAALLTEIASQQVAGKEFARIVLIGHSTGAIYISNFIEYAATVLPNTKFDVIFLAPAITHTRWARTLVNHAGSIAGFRQFGMRDSVECEDRLVSVVYPRSLLYFVSGVVEFATDTAGNPQRESDTPVVGMERYRLDPAVFSAADFPDIATVEAFYVTKPKALVWSVTSVEAPKGEASESHKHGDFDDDSATVDSIVQVLDRGF